MSRIANMQNVALVRLRLWQNMILFKALECEEVMTLTTS